MPRKRAEGDTSAVEQLSAEELQDLRAAVHTAEEAQQLADKHNVQIPLNDGSGKWARPGATELGDTEQPK